MTDWHTIRSENKMIFIYLVLWFLGVAIALLQVFGFQPLFRRIPWLPVRLIISFIATIALWILTTDLTRILVASMGHRLNNQEYISGSAYWLTIIGFFFDKFVRHFHAPKSQPDSLLSEVAASDVRTHVNPALHPEIGSRISDRSSTAHLEKDNTSYYIEFLRRMRMPRFSTLSLVLVFLFGLGTGLLLTHFKFFASKNYTSFEECFLAESEGRQQATFPIVAKLCRDSLRNYALPPGFILETH